MRTSKYWPHRLFVLLVVPSLLAHAAFAQPALLPLSPAQTLLFDTPHLANIEHAEKLRYAFSQTGPAAFDDTIILSVLHVNDDGSKSVTFDYLTGDHHQKFPELDHFRGNPLIMLALEQNVDQLNAALGVSKASLRNRIRDSFLTGATVEPTKITRDGTEFPATNVTVTPFAHADRFDRIPSLQARTYSITVAPGLPGGIAGIVIDTPADTALDAPAFSQKISFVGVEK